MKKNNLKEKNIISALMVGISAMMAISSPITAYAEGEETPDINNNTEPATEETATTIAEPVATAEAQEQADVAEQAIEDIVNEIAPITTEETAADPEDGGKVAEEAVENVIEAAQDLGEAAEEAAEAVTEAKEDLKVAEKADVAQQEEAKDVVEIIMYAEEAAQDAADTVQETKETAEIINEAINQAVEDKNEEKAGEELEKLETLVEQAKETVEIKKIQLDDLNDKYSKAKDELKKAQEEYLEALTDASVDVQEAKNKLNEAKAETANLKDAVETAQEKLEAEEKAANKLVKELKENRESNANWDKQTELLKAYIMGYYIPQVLGTEDESSIKFVRRVKGFDRQDYNYYEFKYTDENGNEVTKYFNQDRIDKKVYEGDPYKGVGGSKEIVIFEKSELEIGADDYLRKLYKDEDWYKEGVEKGNNPAFNTVKDKVKNGDFRVYSYEKDGVTYYISQEQINGKKPETRDVIIDEDGNITVDGCEIKEVIQNSKNKVHGNPDIAGDTSTFKIGDEETEDQVSQFIKEAGDYVGKYKEYTEAVTKAEDATENAIEEVNKLADAIDDLKNQENPVLTAAEALGITDVAAYFGIEVPEDVDMDSMTIEEAIGYLDKLLDKANEKMEEALDDLSSINAQKEAAKKAIDDLAKEKQISPAVIIDRIEENNEEKKEDEKAEETEEKKEDEKAEETEEKKEDEKAEETEEKREDEKEEEKAEDTEEEIKDEEAEIEQKEEKAEKKGRKSSKNNNNNENNRSDESQNYSSNAGFAASYEYEASQDWTIAFTNITDVGMDEAAVAAPAEEMQVLAATRENNDWTETSVIDVVNAIVEDNNEADQITVAKAVKAPEKKSTVVTLNDEEMPLAATIPTEKESHMSWWWLLILLVFGVAGEELYRKYNKEAEETTEK